MHTDTPSTSPLTFGVLGCANIARQFIRDVRPSREVAVVAVASRDADKARRFADENGVAASHGSYEALLADPAVTAIYLPLPNSLHAEWAIKAAEAGKHILCEKPMALDRAEAERMFDAARQHRVMLLEAYPYWFQPQTGALVDLVQGGAIGTVRSVMASFGFMLNTAQANIRLQADMGGGALLDAGSYPLSLIRLVMGGAPKRVSAWSTLSDGDGDGGVDLATMATLDYGDGRRAQLSCAMDGGMHRHATVVGTEGTVYTEYLNHTSDQPAGNAFGHLPSRMSVRRGVAPRPFEVVTSPTGSGFRFAAEAFARLVAEGDVAAMERAAAASIDIAATLDAIGRSARTGQWVEL